MVSKEEYLAAQKLVAEWLDAQPADPKFPFKPKRMGVEDYMRQRALNEMLRFFNSSPELNFENFTDILRRFDLKIFSVGDQYGGKEFIRWQVERPAFPETEE